MANVVAPAAATAPPSDRASNVQSVVISVDGMTCQSCVNTIETQLSTKPGVETVSVSLRDKQAIIMYDVSKTNARQLVDYIDDLGFEASLPRQNAQRHVTQPQLDDVVIHVGGMTCQSCVRNIEDVIGAKAGVRSIKVSLEQKQARIRYDTSVSGAASLRDAIDDMGFEASLEHPLLEFDPLIKRPASTQTVALHVDGMTCQSCVSNITEVISNKAGVLTVNVSLQKKEAQIDYDASVVDAAALRDYIDDMGFEATLPDAGFDEIARRNEAQWTQNTVSIYGMTCKSCVANIEATVGDMAGVRNITVSLTEKQGHVDYDAGQISIDDVIRKIDDMGFTCALLRSEGNDAMTSWSVGNLQQVSLYVQGMRTNTELEQVRALLANSPGVVAVKVTLLNESADVLYNPIHVNPARLCDMVEGAGFTVALQGSGFLHIYVLYMYVGRNTSLQLVLE